MSYSFSRYKLYNKFLDELSIKFANTMNFYEMNMTI